MDNSQIVGIWINFILLLVLSYYMRVYKLPFNILIIPEMKYYAYEEIRKEKRKEMQQKVQEGAGLTEEEQEVHQAEVHSQYDSIVKEEYEEIKRASSSSRWALRINYSRILT